MDTKPVVAPLTIASAMDAHGNVLVWDNGPQEPADVDHASSAWAQYQAELKAWKEAGGLPRSTIMASSDAAHAVTADPGRYTLEPTGVDEGAVAAKVREIQDRRAAAKKAHEDRVAAAQLAADRKEAIAAVMADHVVAAAAKAETDRAAKHKKPMDAPKFGSQLAHPHPPKNV